MLNHALTHLPTVQAHLAVHRETAVGRELPTMPDQRHHQQENHEANPMNKRYQPTNRNRVRKARSALREYLWRGESTADAITDLLTDLHHLASVERLEIAALLSAAHSHYEAELNEEHEQARRDATPVQRVNP